MCIHHMPSQGRPDFLRQTAKNASCCRAVAQSCTTHLTMTTGQASARGTIVLRSGLRSLPPRWQRRPGLEGTAGRADLQGELPLAAALKGRDECGVGDDVGSAALLLHEVEQVARLLPLPTCKDHETALKDCTDQAIHKIPHNTLLSHDAQ